MDALRFGEVDWGLGPRPDFGRDVSERGWLEESSMEEVGGFLMAD